MRVPDKFRLLQTVQLTSSFETYSSPVYWSSLDKQRLLLRISIYTSISHVFLLQMDRKRNEFDEISKQQRLLSSFWSEPRYERESETRFLRPREDVYRCISRGECMHASCLFARFLRKHQRPSSSRREREFPRALIFTANRGTVWNFARPLGKLVRSPSIFRSFFPSSSSPNRAAIL